MKTEKPIDPEVELQGNELHGVRPLFCLLIYCIVAPIAIGCWFGGWCKGRKEAIRHWFSWRRECAWCNQRLGGNPFGSRITHGVCRPCKADFLKSLSSDRSSESQPTSLPPVAAHAAAAGNNFLTTTKEQR